MKEITVRKITKTQFSNNFNILNLSDVLVDKNMEEGLHRHDFFFLLILEQSNGKHHIDFNTYPVTSNSIFLIRPGQVHNLILEQGTKGYLINFDSSFYSSYQTKQKEIFWNVFQKNYYKLNNESFNNILCIAHQIFKEHTVQKFGFEEIIKYNLNILFTELIRHNLENKSYKNAFYSHEQKLLDKFMHLLESQIYYNKQVTKYAEVLNITTYKLNTTTKALLEKTASQLINEQIILEAKRLLLATPNQINEIAFKLGYQDPAYFIRFFKKHTSFTPLIFRQNFT
ncbi:helix-turn-helix domain-containing protein [Tenacibaculum sp. M341]|uniref:helix-turn-helix domain-containing protein n=1 Tax=Tenacibaculum sp. M341 TaxID=2530339 RepID=UPI001043276A|nr:helix-turn-helix domain-containing protein [Tenacibaculum sp. M341]TCI84875.1 helix-turn-helix domain-containing protein [Tenacibaculum sp. M341]